MDSLSSKFDSPYKYFKDAQWYNMKQGAKIHFENEGAKLDVHTLWPKKASVFISNYPNGGKQKDIRNNPERKTYGLRLKTSEVQFLNVLEPYKGISVIDKIDSKSPNEVVVYLKDGRKQKIIITGLKNDKTQIVIEEYVGGKLKRLENTIN